MIQVITQKQNKYVSMFILSIITSLSIIQTACSQENSMPKHSAPTNYCIRKGNLADKEQLKALSIKVTTVSGGLIRTAAEITDDYIDTVLHAALTKGIMFVAEYNGILLGAILKYANDLYALRHVLYEGSVFVDPDYQGMGIGTQLYTTLLDEVKNHHPEILRVNLKVRSSNPAIRLYKRLGFTQEGECNNLVMNNDGTLETVIAMVWFNPNFKNV